MQKAFGSPLFIGTEMCWDNQAQAGCLFILAISALVQQPRCWPCAISNHALPKVILLALSPLILVLGLRSNG